MRKVEVGREERARGSSGRLVAEDGRQSGFSIIIKRPSLGDFKFSQFRSSGARGLSDRVRDKKALGELHHRNVDNGRLRPFPWTLQNLRKAFSDFRSHHLCTAAGADSSRHIVDHDQLPANPEILLDPFPDKLCIADFTLSIIVLHTSFRSHLGGLISGNRGS